MITVTPLAAEKMKKLLEESGHTHLRLFVQGGGCSGFQYGLLTENGSDPNSPITEGDQVFESNGIKIVVDPISIKYLQNTVIDFSDNLMGGGFSVKNPNAKSTCGCGSSFEV